MNCCQSPRPITRTSKSPLARSPSLCGSTLKPDSVLREEVAMLRVWPITILAVHEAHCSMHKGVGSSCVFPSLTHARHISPLRRVEGDVAQINLHFTFSLSVGPPQLSRWVPRWLPSLPTTLSLTLPSRCLFPGATARAHTRAASRQIRAVPAQQCSSRWLPLHRWIPRTTSGAQFCRLIMPSFKALFP
jgi:hypothetical protein